MSTNTFVISYDMFGFKTVALQSKYTLAENREASQSGLWSCFVILLLFQIKKKRSSGREYFFGIVLGQHLETHLAPQGALFSCFTSDSLAMKCDRLVSLWVIWLAWGLNQGGDK